MDDFSLIIHIWGTWTASSFLILSLNNTLNFLRSLCKRLKVHELSHVSIPTTTLLSTYETQLLIEGRIRGDPQNFNFQRKSLALCTQIKDN